MNMNTARPTLIAAGIIALAIVAHGALTGGRYTLTSVNTSSFPYLLDKWTGTQHVCGGSMNSPKCYVIRPMD